MRNRTLRITSFILVITLVTSVLVSCKKESQVANSDKPINISIWHYYNSTQLVEFDALVQKFNKTKGRELGIFVQSTSKGSVNDLAFEVANAAKGALGVGSLPNIFMAYPDSALDTAELGKTVDLSEYMSQKEMDEYVTDFWNEGIINGVPTIFPIAKSTEVLYINEIAWENYASLAGVSGDLAGKVNTWENLLDTAKNYYDFTDALTPDVANDGLAFSGIDSVSNFMIVGVRQQNVELFTTKDNVGTVNIDKEAIKKMWDIFVPSIARGYFSNKGRYRSDDMKTGEVLSFVGSTTSTSYLPKEVTKKDGTTYAARVQVFPMPYISGGKKYAIQQGGGMVVSKSDVKHEFASVEFLKWFTQDNQNLDFAISSAYLPVLKKSLANNALKQKLIGVENSDNVTSQNTAKMFYVALEQLKTYKPYYSAAFSQRLQIRFMLDDLNIVAKKAREDVLSAVNSGMDFEEAVIKYSGQEAFDSWILNFETEAVKLLNSNDN